MRFNKVTLFAALSWRKASTGVAKGFSMIYPEALSQIEIGQTIPSGYVDLQPLSLCNYTC